MIEVEGLTKRYRKQSVVTEVLQGISFRVEAGEFVAIMGPSGSGKSTLMNILGFLDRPDEGRYRFQDIPADRGNDDTLSLWRNSRIGFVFQQFHLLDWASALENVLLPLLYADDSQEASGRQQARRLLERVGLADHMHHRPGEMSGGQQQRTAIARALVTDPALILADEPTGNLDSQSGAEVMDLFRQLHREGRTIVMVTHDREVARHADRILTIEDGRVTSDLLVPGSADPESPTPAA